MIVLSNPIVHPHTSLKVVLLSGLSDPDSCVLSRVQQQFLDRLDVPPECKIYANFPYLPPERDEQASIPLALASWRNLSQFISAKRSPYREHAVAHWQALVDSCEGLLVVTISCGLEILNACLSTGIRPTAMEVIGLGPVAWARPSVPHTLIRGSRDYVLNPFFRSVDLVLPGVGHLNYLDHHDVAQLLEGRMKSLATRIATVKS